MKEEEPEMGTGSEDDGLRDMGHIAPVMDQILAATRKEASRRYARASLDYEIAKRNLDTAQEWLRSLGG